MREFVVRVGILICLLISLTESVAQGQSVAGNAAWVYGGSLLNNRYGHTATLLSDGQVLVAGGGGFPCSGSFCYSSVNQSAEIYNPATNRWTATQNFSRRSSHSATLLPNGQVLAVGGINFGWDIGVSVRLNTAEVFDPASGNWRRVQDPIAVRGRNAAVLLPSGKVLVVGSERPVAELFDASTESWSLTGSPTIGGPLVLLSDGRVLIVSPNSTELYDPDTGTWSGSGRLNEMIDNITVTTLRNGKVLATGLGDRTPNPVELYDPETGVWIVNGNLSSTIWGLTATLLSNGRILIAGGVDDTGFSTDHAELYDPDTGTSIPLPGLKTPRQFHTATPLADGKVLVTAGVNGDFDIGTVFLDSAEVFDLRLPVPTSLSISPGAVSLGQCYSITVENGSNMTLDIQYRLDDGPVRTINKWPVLDANGRAENICTSATTPVGTYQFTAIRNTETTRWVPTSAFIAVSAAKP